MLDSFGFFFEGFDAVFGFFVNYEDSRLKFFDILQKSIFGSSFVKVGNRSADFVGGEKKDNIFVNGATRGDGDDIAGFDAEL